MQCTCSSFDIEWNCGVNQSKAYQGIVRCILLCFFLISLDSSTFKSVSSYFHFGSIAIAELPRLVSRNW